MTELNLFYKHVPDIAKMIGNLREKTPEQRQQWKKNCLEYACSLSPFVHEFFKKTFIVIDKYFEESEGKSEK
ncbi:MAG: hypothetical protein K2N44_12950 [Lachnospiraceae bacterium]|nr:hypothetical protein [Lachnospiraceae bacterium]